jgi:N4-gp56 family major capsid protein
MAGQTYASQTPRIGKWKGEILARAIPCEVLQLQAVPKSMPKNVSDTVVYRRWVPYNATVANPNKLIPDAIAAETEAANRVDAMVTANLLTEGTTPVPDSLVAQDITVILRQLGCLYSFSDKVADLYEDDLSDALKTQVAERMTLIRELDLYIKLRGGTNRFYGGIGTSVATVDGKITPKMLRKIARAMNVNHAKKPTEILSASPNIGTVPIEAAYIVFCSGDVDADLRDTVVFPGYTPVAEYGSRKPLHENELGSFEQFRFIYSPELVALQGAGVAVGTTGLLSTVGAKVDVYPILVVAKEAYGNVALRGSKSFDLSVIPVGNKDSADPLGQRGYVGSKFYSGPVILNQQWMAVAFVGVSDLA